MSRRPVWRPVLSPPLGLTVEKGSSNYARTTPCAPSLSLSSQARVTSGIAVVDSTSVFISSLQWSQRISTIQLGICHLPNLNVVLGIIN